MDGLQIVYAVVLVIAVVQWAFNRYQLARGLSLRFYTIRLHPQFNQQFEKKITNYISLLVGLFVQLVFVWFCGYRLLFDLGVLILRLALFLVSLCCFLLKIGFITSRLFLSSLDGGLNELHLSCG